MGGTGKVAPLPTTASCGAIANYTNGEPAPGPDNLALGIGERLTLRGIIVSDHNALMPRFLAEAAAWLAAGRFRCDETVVDGLERAPEAFLALVRGANTGKMLVRLAD